MTALLADDFWTYVDRRGPGECWKRHHAAKLTEDDVRAIRRKVADGHGHTFEDIARTYGISRQAVGLIVQRKRWAHVS